MADFKDITKTGPVALKGLPGLNKKQLGDTLGDFEKSALLDTDSMLRSVTPSTQRNVGLELASQGYGDSSYDDNLQFASQAEDLNEVRAIKQPWYAQIGAGVAKGAVLAGTTLLDGTFGLLFGGVEAGIRASDDKSTASDIIAGMWDNDFSRALQTINEKSEELLPNYYTKDETEQPWYNNIFTANFLGDKFIKNLGFTVGAFYSGMVGASVLKASKIPQLIGTLTKLSEAPALVTSGIGSVISAVNEGRIEALNNSKDWFNLHKTQFDDKLSNRLSALKSYYEEGGCTYEDYMALCEKEKNAYNETLYQLSKDRAKMGNVDLALNIPILTFSNFIQFGKLFANGFKTSRRVSNIINRGGVYTPGTSKLGAAAAFTKDALSEGTEEITQKMASTISGNYYGTDVNNFYKSKTDPNASKETLDWIKAFATGINETVNDASSWEEFTIGALTGALGMPKFRSITNSEGKIQSPITIEGGLIGAIKDYREKAKGENEIADYLNQRVSSPEFKNYYQGLIRHKKYQNDMNKASDEGDVFNFKNAEHAQLVSDIAMFDNAGRLEDLMELIKATFDVSDENLASIVKNTTSVTENGEKAGPFIDSKGNPMYVTPEGKQEMIDKIKKNHDDLINTINNYLKVKNDLDSRTSQQLSDDQLEELTWMKSQLSNWSERGVAMSGEVKSAIGKVMGNLESLLRVNEQIRTYEGQAHADLSDEYKQVDKNVRAIQGALNTLTYIRSQSDEVLASLLATNPKFVSGLIKEINEVDETALSADEKEDIIAKLNDIVKLGNASKTYNAKLKEYLKTPQKQAEDHARADEQAAQQETATKTNNIKASLNAATNLSEFRKVVDDNIDDIENLNDILDELENEDSEMAKNYRETSQYNNEVRRVLNESDAEPQVKQDAMKLLQDQFSNSEKLEQLANPNSIYINNENAFDEDSGGDVELSATRFQEAQYELQKAMAKVNNDNKFKDRFSPEYKKPVEKREGIVRGDNRTHTGDSQTATTPPVGSSEALPTTETPVGNITTEMVSEENKQTNRRVEMPARPKQGESKKYYRPAIPELHIEASKEGDFRAFDIVVREKEGANFEEIYNYLRDKGAFDYLNSGKLKIGATLGFMIDPEFEKRVEGQEWHKAPTIFIIDKSNGQVVGSLDEGASMNGFEGLAALEERVRKEYEEPISLKDAKPGTTIITPKGDKQLKVVSNNLTNKEQLYDYTGNMGGTLPVWAESKGNTKVDVLAEKEPGVINTEDISISKDELIHITNTSNGLSHIGELKEWSKKVGDVRKEPDGWGTYNGLTYYKVSHKGGRSGDNVTIWFKTEPSENVKLNLTQIIESSKNLEELGDKLAAIINTFNVTPKTQSKGKFIASPTTRVSKIMVGRIPYGNTERSLSEIPNVSSESHKPVFGIIKNGVLTTNGKIDDSLIIKPVDMSQKEGRLYLLIPNGAGKYSPAAIRVKHFNNEEFNLNDSSVSSSPVGEDIKNAITKLSTATSQDDVSAAMQDLAQDLYMQDVMITWFSSKAGDGIVISKKVRKPDGTYEKVTIDGKEQIKEDKYDVYFSTSKKSAEINGITFDAAALQGTPEASLLGVPKNPEDIYKEILEHLIKFNLPLQVSARRINEGVYNNRLINSNILTSNITEASVRSNWFTTDYFDNEGNLHQAISPASVAPQPKRKVETPVGGIEGAVAGTRIVSVFSNKPYYVDLKTNTIRDDQGRTVEVTDSNRILFDLAWAQDNFGDVTISSMMVDNKVLTPDGKVLDRSKQVYLSGQEAQNVKDIITGRNKGREDRIAKSKEVVNEIYENQKRVDKTRTDGEFYYVLEDDGEYHQYSRVHSRLGSNWIESAKQTKALELARLNLSKFVDNPVQYENYLKYLEKKFEVDLSAYRGKTDAKSRDTIVNIVRDKMSGTNSQRALNAGSAVDSVIRQFFTMEDSSKIVKPSNMSDKAFVDLITTLNEIKSAMNQMGERFLTDNIVLFQKYPDGTRVAGEVDILAIDKDGNFKIYDVKTSRYSFYEFTDNYGHRVNYFTTPSHTQRMSTKDYYTLQLSAYKNLFESQYGVPITTLAIMPFVLSYDKENVSSVQSEKGIPIAYNPAVNVPLVGNVKVNKSTETPATPAQAQAVLPIFETSLEIQKPIEDLTPEHKSTDKDKVGYFELDGKLHKGYLTPLATINGVEIHLTKTPNITKGYGKAEAHVATNSFYAVFPNGKTFLFLENSPVQGGMTQSQVEDAVKKALENNPQRVKDLSSEKTILFNPDAMPPASNPPAISTETPATINQGNTQTGAAYTAQKEQAINDHDEEFEDEFTLRRVKETTEVHIWNQEKELEWLKKVLPQLSEQDRVKVVNGLIKVGKRGTLAWGQFDKGVITLSNIAAEGTTYHEAFHVVFNLLLNNNERTSLLNEYRKKYPNLTNIGLEEKLAEDFREFVMNGGKDTRSLGRKILDFFKSLFIKTKYWKDFRPSSIYYFRAINEGKYTDTEMPIEPLSQIKTRQSATENVGTYSKDSDDIRYREVNENDLSKALDNEYYSATKKVRELNNNRYNTEEAAISAFNNSGISKELFYRITRKGANNATGYKIQLLTNEQFNNYKESIIEREKILNERKAENWYFESLGSEIQMTLLDKGWTMEKFNSISQEERDQAIKCIAF